MFRDIGMDEIAGDDPPSEDELAEAAAVLVAADDRGELVGYARIELVGDHAHLEQVSVLPERAGEGVGTALLDAVEAWAQRLGLPQVTLTTFRDVPFNAPLSAPPGFTAVPEADWPEELREVVAAAVAHGLHARMRIASGQSVYVR